MSNKKLLGGAIVVGIIVLLAFAFGGIGIEKLINPADPEATTLDRQVKELKARNAHLRSQIEKYIVEIRDLNAQVNRQAGAQPGGLEAEETRKALAVREAELDRREKRLVELREELRVNQTKLEGERQKFYSDRGLRVEEIGQAKEIKENQERMLDRLKQTEERAERAEGLANRWLMFIYGLSVALAIGMLVFAAFLYRTYINDRRIDRTMQAVGSSVSLSTRDRNLLMALLGGRILEQPPDDDSTP